MYQQHTHIKIQGDDEDYEDAEEEEDEPRLKYQRMGGSVPSLLSNDAATCLAVAQRMIALGTRNGSIHILDFLGNQVKEFPAHTAAVNDLCFDVEGEYIGSCSDDGSVIITGLFTEEKLKFDYYRPMKAIAVDPYYAKRSSRRFVAGGLAGHLYINTKNWIGYRDQVLHSGEGPIHAVKWRTNLIAWANDAGVKVYDSANNQRITFIERPRGSPFPEILLPHLVWQDDNLLVIGWGTSVKIALIRTNQTKTTNGPYGHIMSNMNKLIYQEKKTEKRNLVTLFHCARQWGNFNNTLACLTCFFDLENLKSWMNCRLHRQMYRVPYRPSFLYSDLFHHIS